VSYQKWWQLRWVHCYYLSYCCGEGITSSWLDTSDERRYYVYLESSLGMVSTMIAIVDDGKKNDDDDDDDEYSYCVVKAGVLPLVLVVLLAWWWWYPYYYR
jgi:hypothetical protein